jgi:hypothetical protein
MKRLIVAALGAVLLTTPATAGWRGHYGHRYGGHYHHHHGHGRHLGGILGGLIVGGILAHEYRRHYRPRYYAAPPPPSYPHPYYAQPPTYGTCYSCGGPGAMQ